MDAIRWHDRLQMGQCQLMELKRDSTAFYSIWALLISNSGCHRILVLGRLSKLYHAILIPWKHEMQNINFLLWKIKKVSRINAIMTAFWCKNSRKIRVKLHKRLLFCIDVSSPRPDRHPATCTNFLVFQSPILNTVQANRRFYCKVSGSLVLTLR